ncbi:MAG TPA: Ig-like domain-containing protein [Hanamia sp.]
MAVAVCYYLFTMMSSGCAQIGMPMGGPRDTTPPVLLNATPPNHMLHFTANHATFTFDEYVQIKDVQKYLLVNPVPKIIPTITSKLKTVSIKIRDTLQPNTTYSFDFGNAIQDINENNPIRNFTYVFSTGNYIDSLQLQGKVVLAQTGKPDSTLIVVLFNNLDDSAVYKVKPKYVANLDSLGRYHFKYLAAGTYHLFALKDESGQKMYNNPSQLFAFADSDVHITKDVQPIALFAYAQEENTKSPASLSSAKPKNPEKILKFTSSVSSGSQDLLTPLTITLVTPLKDFDSSKIRLSDTLFNPIAAAISLDSTKKIIKVKAGWTEDTHYRLLIDKDFATDTLGEGLKKADTISFKTKSEREYGSLKLDFRNRGKIKHPVLQFIQNNVLVDSFKISSATFIVKLFNPGDYEVRILDDENDNGSWDPGNYHLRKQPEKVTAIPKKVNVKADWDNEYDIVL